MSLRKLELREPCRGHETRNLGAHQRAHGATFIKVSTEGARILAVDDDPASLRLLVRHLEKAGHEVVTATNGKQALAAALQSNPQIIITDWRMPEMDGVQLCKTLRRFGSGRDLYILLLADRSEEERVDEAIEAGIDDYILKPFKPKLLQASVRRGQRVVRLQERIEQDKRTQREQVARLAVMTRKLRAVILTDDVTGLPNRRSFRRRLDREWDAARTDGLALGVIWIELVDWEIEGAVRGTLSHEAVMGTAAGILQEALPARDTVAFWEGESFLVLAPDVTRDELESLARRCLRDLAANAIDADGREVRMWPNAGIAIDDNSFEGPQDVIEAADGALQRAKAHSGNTCSW